MSKESTSPNPPPRAREVSATPVSSGGGGVFFEQHVGALWLTLLVTRGFLPIVKDSTCVQVHFQAERLGWNTDDFVLEGQNGAGARRRLIGQVKRSFTLSASDEECCKTIRDFWSDYKQPERISTADDRFVLVTLRGTNVLLEGLGTLLDHARAARDSNEFDDRLNTKGLVSAKALSYCGEIRKIIADIEGREVASGEIWELLRILHVLPLDLTTSTAQTEAVAKSLLALTANDADAVGAATRSWDSLLRLAGEANPEGRSFRRIDLPSEVTDAHRQIAAPEHQALRALAEHSQVILNATKSTIGKDLHLSRASVVQAVIEKLESSQVVIISGAAGSGKSGVARDVVEQLRRDHFVFSFRAVEFASTHLDETLQRVQIPASGAALAATLAGQPRKVMLVESVERLLEASTRDGFADLLALMARDQSWHMILTCRDYSTDLVRDSFLANVGLAHCVVGVSALSDEELDEVVQSCPQLVRPLGDPALRRLLRNPYILDKALLVPWGENGALPQDERGFRTLCWRQIVRAESRPAARMPARRGDVFVQVALRRARALTPYADCQDLDLEAAKSLKDDSLLVDDERRETLMAPAHDVLEDWAVLQWLDEQGRAADADADKLSAAIGSHPALRRSYRKWLGELVAGDRPSADRLFDSVLRSGVGRLPAHFQDDTMVALLRAPDSSDFLRQHQADLLANEKLLFLRVIHILRVACVTAPPWVAAHEGLLFSVPAGDAWAGVLSLVASNLVHFGSGDGSLLLGLLEDWANGVDWQTPYPEGSNDAVRIAHWLLPHFGGYSHNDNRKRVLRFLARLPKADPDGLARILRERPARRDADRLAAELAEMLLDGLDGWVLARDLPELLVEIARKFFLATESELHGERGFRSHRLGVELAFGMREHHGHFAPPASAYRGPFLPLLRRHPRTGLEFLLGIFNHSVDWYVRPRVHDPLEPADEVKLALPDGFIKTQWCNGRLWGLYRGMTVAPYALQSMAMALEQWLREYAEAGVAGLDDLLIRVLRGSDSAALTAVVAAVATAHPRLAPETLLLLLRARWPVQMDKSRFAHELSSPSGIFDHLPSQPGDRLFVEERRAADAKPYRRQDLEGAICNLQLTTHQQRVWEALDDLRSRVPPPKERDEEDRVWLLALHRMDLRQYRVAGAEPPLVDETGGAAESATSQVLLQPTDPEPDVKAMTEATALESQRMNARLGLFLWGSAIFSRDEGKADPSQWRTHLAEARRTPAHDEGGFAGFGDGGVGFVAAVCVRDHWDDMSAEERAWSMEAVLAEVHRSGDVWDRHSRIQLGSFSPDRACAFVASALLGKALSPQQLEVARRCLVVAVTHPSDEVRRYAAEGVGAHLWSVDRDLVLRCVNAIATEAKALHGEAEKARRRRVFSPSDDGEATHKRIVSRIRAHFGSDEEVSADAYATLDVRGGFGAEANMRALTIFGYAPEDEAAIAAYRRVADALVAWWDDGDDERRSVARVGTSRNYQLEFGLRHQLERFVLRTNAVVTQRMIEPLLEAVDRHPKEVGQFIEGLIVSADHSGASARFWEVWTAFAERAKAARWLDQLDSQYGFGREVIKALFLCIAWKDGVRHWRCIDGFQSLVPGLFDALPPRERVLHDFVQFLYHVGEQSLPTAFVQIAEKIRAGNARAMLGSDTVFMLERMLQRFTYTRPAELKGRRDTQEAVLFLLDELVESGSSAAFRMRDDFVTPLPTMT